MPAVAVGAVEFVAWSQGCLVAHATTLAAKLDSPGQAHTSVRRWVCA